MVLPIVLVSLFFSSFCFGVDSSFSKNYDFYQLYQKNIINNSKNSKYKKRFERFSSEGVAIEIYSKAYALWLVNTGNHLHAIGKKDKCQIAKDIRDRAVMSESPIYQHFFGDMLIHGVCFRKNIIYGFESLRASARQGFPPAMLALAKYYTDDKHLIRNGEKAVRLAYEAAKLGNIKARLFLVELFLSGYGNVSDYEQAYNWLYHSYFDSKDMQEKAYKMLSIFVNLIPPRTAYKIHNLDHDEF